MEAIARRDTSPAANPSNATRKRVVAPIERDGKTFWLRVGAAFQNRDLSWNLYIDAMPFNGRLQLRDWDEPYKNGPMGGQGGGGTLELPAVSGAGAASVNDNHTDPPF